jgi:hypothetical protein
VECDKGAEKPSRNASSSGRNVGLSVWSHKGPTLKGIRNWAPPGTQLFFPGLRSDTFWTGWYDLSCIIKIMKYQIREEHM